MTEILQGTNDPTGVDAEEFNEEELIEQLKENKESIEKEEDKEEEPAQAEEEQEELSTEKPAIEETPREEDGGLIDFFDKNYSPIEEKEEPVETVESMLDSIDNRINETLFSDREAYINAEMNKFINVFRADESFNELEEEEKQQKINNIFTLVSKDADSKISQNYEWYKENIESEILGKLPEKERANISFVKNLVSKGKGNIDLKGARVIAKVVEDVYTKLREKETEINNKIASLEKKAKNKTEAYSESVGRNKGSVSLSKEELIMIKKVGLTPEQYLKYNKQ